MKTLYQYLTESNLQDVDVICGRFMPLHKGHLAMMANAYKKYGNPIKVMAQHSSKIDAKHPFSDELFQKQFDLIHRAYPYIELYFTEQPSPANFDTTKPDKQGRVGWGKIMRENRWNPIHWLCGADRTGMYDTMCKKYGSDNGFNDIVATEIDDRTSGASATRIREAILADDREAFEDGMPECLWGLYDSYREELNKV